MDPYDSPLRSPIVVPIQSGKSPTFGRAPSLYPNVFEALRSSQHLCLAELAGLRWSDSGIGTRRAEGFELRLSGWGIGIND